MTQDDALPGAEQAGRLAGKALRIAVKTAFIVVVIVATLWLLGVL